MERAHGSVPRRGGRKARAWSSEAALRQSLHAPRRVGLSTRFNAPCQPSAPPPLLPSPYRSNNIHLSSTSEKERHYLYRDEKTGRWKITYREQYVRLSFGKMRTVQVGVEHPTDEGIQWQRSVVTSSRTKHSVVLTNITPRRGIPLSGWMGAGAPIST